MFIGDAIPGISKASANQPWLSDTSKYLIQVPAPIVPAFTTDSVKPAAQPESYVAKTISSAKDVLNVNSVSDIFEKYKWPILGAGFLLIAASVAKGSAKKAS